MALEEVEMANTGPPFQSTGGKGKRHSRIVHGWYAQEPTQTPWAHNSGLT